MTTEPFVPPPEDLPPLSALYQEFQDVTPDDAQTAIAAWKRVFKGDELQNILAAPTAVDTMDEIE